MAQSQWMVRFAIWHTQQRCVERWGNGRLHVLNSSLIARISTFKKICHLPTLFTGIMDLSNSLHLFISPLVTWN